MSQPSRQSLDRDLARAGITPPEGDRDAILRTARFLADCAARVDAWIRSVDDDASR